MYQYHQDSEYNQISDIHRVSGGHLPRGNVQQRCVTLRDIIRSTVLKTFGRNRSKILVYFEAGVNEFNVTIENKFIALLGHKYQLTLAMYLRQCARHYIY